MKKPKICFLQYSLRGGGAERKVCTLANYFANQGYDVEIGLFGINETAYTLDDRVNVTFIDRVSYEYKNGIEKVCFQCKEKLESLLTFVSGMGGKKIQGKFEAHYKNKNNYLDPIRRYIANRPDTVFISMMVSVYLTVVRVMEPYWKSDIPVPYLVMECNDPKKNADSQMDHDRTMNYPRATRVLAQTQGAKEYFSPEIQAKCVVIPNPVRDDLPDPYTGKRRKVIVNYCRLNRQKNLPLLLEAFTEFGRKFPEYKLEIYGEGELLSELNSKIIDLGIADKACIYPFDSNIHKKIRDCAMYVSSSDWEGFPNSTLEALAIGLPTIATDCDFGPRDMIRDHENGLLVPTGEVNALTKAMTELAESPELSEKISKEAIKVREIFSVDRIGQQWINIINEVAKEKGIQ